MDLEAFKRGDPNTLEEVVDRAGPWVYTLARRGFVCFDALTIGAERTRIRVLGAATPDVAAALTERVLAAALTPARRAEASGPESVDQAILEEARVELFRAADRAGRLVGLSDPAARASVPPEVEDLDVMLTTNRRPVGAGLPLTERLERRITTGEAVASRYLEDLDERSRRIVELRFVQGLPAEEVAKQLDCGKVAVEAHEGRIRRQARFRIRAALDDPRTGSAEVDALLAGRPRDVAPAPVTWERIRRGVLRRTFRKEPSPYPRRLAWALAVLAVGMTGWVLMLTGVLPSFADDPFPTPRVELRCNPACVPGATAHVAVLAPRKATRFAVALRRPGGEVEPLLVAPDGGTLRLPFGARARTLPAPYPVRLPSDLEPGAAAVAVFSETPLSSSEVLDLAAGRTARAETLTATTAAVL